MDYLQRASPDERLQHHLLPPLYVFGNNRYTSKSAFWGFFCCLFHIFSALLFFGEKREYGGRWEVLSLTRLMIDNMYRSVCHYSSLRFMLVNGLVERKHILSGSHGITACL